MRTRIGAAALDIAEGWADARADADGPFEFSRTAQDAVGVLQLSYARYQSGRIPDPQPGDLARMLVEFAEAHGLGKPTDEALEASPLRLAAATFHDGTFAIRAWYVSDGASFVKATYTANAQANYFAELADCERMVRTLAFSYGQAA
jgi:hypothetical protein